MGAHVVADGADDGEELGRGESVLWLLVEWSPGRMKVVAQCGGACSTKGLECKRIAAQSPEALRYEWTGGWHCIKRWQTLLRCKVVEGSTSSKFVCGRRANRRRRQGHE